MKKPPGLGGFFMHYWQSEANFNNPDGNSLEFICAVEVPETMRDITDKLSLEQWNELSC